MGIRPLDLMDPEEAVGNLWHDYATGLGAAQSYPHAAVTLTSLRPSLSVLFRALGGTQGVEVIAAAAQLQTHRRSVKQKLGAEREMAAIAAFDGERLRLPEQMDQFADPTLNKAAYFWWTALAAVVGPDDLDPFKTVTDAAGFDLAQITLNTTAAERAYAACPGLRVAYDKLRRGAIAARPDTARSHPTEAAILDQLAGRASALPNLSGAGRAYLPFAPVPVWLRYFQPGFGEAATDGAEDKAAPPPTATTTLKKGFRKDQEQANRKDSFIIHRFESILSWVESMNINRSVDDDDDENAQKAAEDQDNITLSKHDKRAATRLKLHLDLSPAEADMERISDTFTYPEWNFRSRNFMSDHCRVLEAEAPSDQPFTPNAKRVRAVRRQFEAMHPRRVLQKRQLDGSELDLDALIAARVDLRATGRSSNRIFINSRQIERDLTVAVLVDTSRSTEAAVNDTSVIEVARDTLGALASGIEVSGDRLGIWGFSSLKRDRVSLTRCKGFDEPLNAQVMGRIGALRPGHYTRLGAAIRHTTALLSEETASRRLLLVLTDGKPNDLDHYEGQHGIEDSHMAVREARRAGLIVHGVIIDEDGQDWFARIFGRGGFSLLAHPERLPKALPDIYRNLTQET